MSSVLDQMKRMENSTEAERTLIAWIAENPQEFLQLSTTEISARSFVSVSTMYRLCDKLGFSGLAQMKLQMAGEVQSPPAEAMDSFNFCYPFQAGDSLASVLSSLHQDYRQTLQITADMFDEQELEAAAQALKKAKFIDVYASAGNFYFAQNFQFQMLEIGVPVSVYEGEYSQRLQASVSSEDHVAVVISYGGRGLLFYWIMDILQKRKTPVILIGTDENPVLGLADFNLQMSATEDHHRKISSFSTRLSLLFILDALYSAYFLLDYESNVRRKEEFYRTSSGRMETQSKQD